MASFATIDTVLRPVAGFCLAVMASCASTSSASIDRQNEEAIRSVVAKYVRSVDAADTGLAREVWADAPGISFIHPLGHERGWTEIKTNLYEKIMRDMLSTRKLTVHDLSVKLYGDTAQTEFYWVFDAKWRKDDSAMQTKGRETQVLRKSARGTWEIVHVHYSGIPAIIPGQGL
ncbi:MAG: nuclear transport factor 2 family protein [Bryobacterales bacterium]|nr:nuclear transport factor 2 family protein [Bryobacterales bacterium]